MIRRPALLLAAALSAGCAFTNPANRPVWNAFEEHLVPADDTWFAVTLPVTAPLGFTAILVDSLIVHPVQVIDDAADDAARLWRDRKWAERYYSELAGLPLRAVGTPVVFTLSFLSRSIFDTDTARADGDTEEPAAAAAARAELVEWLRGVGRGAIVPYRGEPVADVDEELEQAIDDALESAGTQGRLAVYGLARGIVPAGAALDPTAGLRDRDPVVRYLVLSGLPARTEVEPALVDALRTDPVESVRELAAARWPR